MCQLLIPSQHNELNDRLVVLLSSTAPQSTSHHLINPIAKGLSFKLILIDLVSVFPRTSVAYIYQLPASSVLYSLDMPPTITTSRSILMHSSLACLSPELQTFDSIVQRPHLPVEILLHIRSYLLPAVTNHLMQRSTSALTRYESSLRDLLCSDCIAYNQFIYGPDIWQWEHFTGACNCTGIKYNAHRSGIFNSQEYIQVHPDYTQVYPDPQRFATAMEWLEFYLTLESSRLKQHRSYQRHSFGIWDVVEQVLREHRCYIFRNPAAGSRLYLGGDMNSVVIAALPSFLERNGEEIVMGDGDNAARQILCQARRDLGLSVDCDRASQMSKEVLRSRHPIRSPSHPMSPTSPSVAMSLMQSQCPTVLHTTATLIVAWMSLPLTFATLALTILCFYSKPRSLRIL
jgi:hypothetical protein